MASKDVELKLVMENLPIGALDNELSAEIQVMLQREYADGVKVTVSVPEKPKKAKDNGQNQVPVTIAASGTVSTIAAGNGMTPVGVYLPGTFTGTALTFLASRVNGQTGLVSDGAGGSYTRTVRAGDYVPLSRDLFTGIDSLQIISGSTEAAARALIVVFN